MDDKQLYERLVVLNEKITQLEKNMGLVCSTIDAIVDDKKVPTDTDKWLQCKIQMSDLR